MWQYFLIIIENKNNKVMSNWYTLNLEMLFMYIFVLYWFVLKMCSREMCAFINGDQWRVGSYSYLEKRDILYMLDHANSFNCFARFARELFVINQKQCRIFIQKVFIGFGVRGRNSCLIIDTKQSWALITMCLFCIN